MTSTTLLFSVNIYQTALFLLVDVDQTALFYLVDGRCWSTSILLRFSSRPSSKLFKLKFVIFFSVFELLERGEVLVVPTDNPLEEQETWLAFRDVVLGLEYRKSL